MRKSLALAAVVLGLCAAAYILRASAGTYPSRVITVVVPYRAGGPTDTIARILAERMGPAISQTIIVENIGGAGRVAYSPPDDYTAALSRRVEKAGLHSAPIMPARAASTRGFWRQESHGQASIRLAQRSAGSAPGRCHQSARAQKRPA